MSRFPLFEALRAQAKSEKTSFHMPGHRPDDFAKPGFLHLLQYDTTEVGDLGDLNHLSGIAKEATSWATEALGAGTSRLITQGSTTAISIMLASCTLPGDSILVSRTAHRSVINAMALLDLKPLWLEAPGLALHDLSSQIDEETVARQICSASKLKAVILTAPNYYGTGLDLAKIAAACQKRSPKTLLLLDYAHGAHMLASDNPRYHPFRHEVDAFVTSAHKTLPALTGAAWLAFSKQLVETHPDIASRMTRLAPTFTSSSPSWVIAASLDYARHVLENEAAGLVQTQIELQQRYLGSLPSHIKWRQRNKEYDDPLRICLEISASPNYVEQLELFLRQEGIWIEMRDLRRLVLIPGLRQPKKDYIRLNKALHKFAPPTASDTTKQAMAQGIEGTIMRHYFRPSEQQMSLRQALFEAKVERVPLAEAGGRISADILSVYPPGNCLVAPGERISGESVGILSAFLDYGLTVPGVDAKRPSVSVVVLE